LQDELAPVILSLLAVFPAPSFNLAFFQLQFIAESILFSKKKIKINEKKLFMHKKIQKREKVFDK